MTQTQIPIEDLIRRYEQLYLPAVTDVLDRKGYTNQWLGRQIKPVGPVFRIAGEAFTVKYAHSLLSSEEKAVEADTRMLDEIRRNHVIVVDNAGNQITGLWGGMSALVARQRGVKALVVAGGVRDTSYIIEQGLPIFAEFTSPLDSLGRFKVVATNVPININDVTVYPGDIVVGDMDGIVCVPRAMAEEVLDEAEALVEQEKKIRNALKNGIPPCDVGKEFGHF